MNVQLDRRNVSTAVFAGILLAAIGYVVLLSPWHTPATVRTAQCPHELTWHSDLYVAQPGLERSAGTAHALADRAYDAGCAQSEDFPSHRVVSVYSLPGVAPEAALVDPAGQVWSRAGAPARDLAALHAALSGSATGTP